MRAHCDTTPDLSSFDYSQYRPDQPSDLPLAGEQAVGSFDLGLDLLIGQETISQLFELITSNVEILRTFADKIPLFVESLGCDTRDQLLLNSYLELFSLRLAYQ